MEQITEIQEIKVSYNRNYGKQIVCRSEEAYLFSKQIYSLTDSNASLKEYFMVMYLNRANHVIGFYKLSEGAISGTVVDVRIALSIALKCLASNLILIHNHPSGHLKPSDPDRRLTRKFKDACALFDLQVLDHLIISTEDYFSFADEGLL